MTTNTTLSLFRVFFQNRFFDCNDLSKCVDRFVISILFHRRVINIYKYFAVPVENIWMLYNNTCITVTAGRHKTFNAILIIIILLWYRVYTKEGHKNKTKRFYCFYFQYAVTTVNGVFVFFFKYNRVQHYFEINNAIWYTHYYLCVKMCIICKN